MRALRNITIVLTVALFSLATGLLVQAQRQGRGRASSGRNGGVKDPGVRADAVDAGQPFPNLGQSYGETEWNQ
jgi:hypothetical protein